MKIILDCNGLQLHQKIDKPTYRYPRPLSKSKPTQLLSAQLPPEPSTTIRSLIADNSGSSPQVVADHSASTRREVVEDSTKGSDEREKKKIYVKLKLTCLCF